MCLDDMKVIFYDGYCPMCNGWVKAIIRFDKQKRFHFAALDSEVARRMLYPLLPDYQSEDTIILLDEEKVYLRSDAALRILGYLPQPVSWLKAGRIIPKQFRDAIYRRIAANRYRWGKRFDACPVPPPAWRDRFLH